MTVSDGAWSVRQKIISDFTVKVRNYIAHQTADRTTLVWPFYNNTAWGNGAGGAQPPYNSNVLANIILGSPSRGTESVDLATDPNGPTNGDLPAGSITATQVTNLITYWMGQYSRSHRVTLNNTGSGNSGFSQVQLVVRLTQAQGGATAAVNSAVSSAITASGINSGTVATAEAVNDLIDQCQLIWKQQCRDVSRKTYNYNYCHANHLSHSNHGSRGRR